MEYETDFNRAVTGGDVNALINLKRAHTMEEMSAMAKRRNLGKPALLTACTEGHYDVVKFLLDECNVDIEETCELVGYSEDEERTAMHIAAARGHLNVVELLLTHGAHVNAATKTQAHTPLYLACRESKLDIVKCLLDHGANVDDADSLGYTSLMVATDLSVVNYLLSSNADVHKKTLNGETVLHTCCGIEFPDGGDIFFALVQHGASIHAENRYGITPPVEAAIEGRDFLIDGLLDTPFIDLLSRKQIIEIQEVYGAYIIMETGDIAKACDFWMPALGQRNIEPQMPKEGRHPSAYAFGQRQEFRDAKTLRRYSRSMKTMSSQAILVLERVLGPAHPFTTYSVLAGPPAIERCLRVLEMQRQYLQPLDYDIEKTLRNSRFAEGSEESVLLCFSKWIDHLAIGKRYLEEDSNSTNTYFPSLTSFLCGILEFGTRLLMADVQVQDVWRKLVKLDLRVANGYTPLHLTSSPQSSFDWDPCMKLLPLNRKLLSVGADPNARDEDGNTPLHLAAMMRNKFHNRMELAQDLIDAGARTCASNHNGETFLDLVEEFEYEDWRNEFCSGKSMELACLAARVLKKNKIPFEKLLPSNAVDFVHNH